MRRFRAAQAVLVLAVGSRALARRPMTPAPVFLTCVAAPGVPEAPQLALCDALADELTPGQSGPPGRAQRRGAQGAMSVVLTVTQALPQQITADLAWQDGTARGSAPPLSLSVVDTALKQSMYGQLVAGPDQTIRASRLIPGLGVSQQRSGGPGRRC